MVLLVTGCNAAPPISPTGGVDGLVIPTPSPSVSDFTAEVDNPWFPLLPGSRWRYRLLGATSEGATVLASVVGGSEIAEVDTVGLRTLTTSAGGTVTEVIDYYAQDQAGNVWWFGRDGVWSAGEPGARAGLVMAARPRLGDGYRQASAPGFTESRAQVLLVGQRFTTSRTTYDGVVAIASEDDLRPTARYVSYYAPGVGLIRREVRDTVTGTIELEEFEAGAG